KLPGESRIILRTSHIRRQTDDGSADLYILSTGEKPGSLLKTSLWLHNLPYDTDNIFPYFSCIFWQSPGSPDCWNLRSLQFPKGGDGSVVPLGFPDLP